MTFDPQPEWAGSRAQKALDQVRRHGQAEDIPCVICNLPIDYTLRHPNKQACTVQHLKPRATHPHLTWDPGNWAPAHADCNSSQGTTIATGIGLVSPW